MLFPIFLPEKFHVQHFATPYSLPGSSVHGIFQARPSRPPNRMAAGRLCLCLDTHRHTGVQPRRGLFWEGLDSESPLGPCPGLCSGEMRRALEAAKSAGPAWAVSRECWFLRAPVRGAATLHNLPPPASDSTRQPSAPPAHFLAQVSAHIMVGWLVNFLSGPPCTLVQWGGKAHP